MSAFAAFWPLAGAAEPAALDSAGLEAMLSEMSKSGAVSGGPSAPSSVSIPVPVPVPVPFPARAPSLAAKRNAAPVLSASLAATAPQKMAMRRDTYSGYPVPRFVAAKGRRTNCRRGPSLGHRIDYTFQRPGVPLLVVAESKDHWRKVRDAAGDECWVYRTTLTQQSHVIVRKTVTLRAGRSDASMERATLAPGVFARLEKTRAGEDGGKWLLLSTEEARGWARADEKVWGGDPMLASAAR